MLGTCLGNIILRWTIVKIDINIHTSMLEQKKIHNYAFMWRTLIEFGMVRTTRTQLDCTCPRTEYTTSLGGIWCTTATFTHGLSIEDIGLANRHRWWILPLSPLEWYCDDTYLTLWKILGLEEEYFIVLCCIVLCVVFWCLLRILWMMRNGKKLSGNSSVGFKWIGILL